MAAWGRSRAPIGTLCRLPETRALMIQVMQEIVAVAQAQHIALPADVIPRTLAELAQFPQEVPIPCNAI